MCGGARELQSRGYEFVSPSASTRFFPMLTPFFRTNHNFLLSPFTDGFAVPVGYYDARVKQLRLVKQGNVWPGSSDFLTLLTSHDDPMDAIFKLNLSNNKIEIFFFL